MRLAVQVAHQGGVEFVEGPTVQPWGSFAKFKDPDGNTFVLSSS